MAIRKQNDKYQVTVYIGTDPVTGKDKREYLGSYKTKREANAVEDDFKHQLRMGTYIDVTNKTLNEGAKVYFESVAPYNLSEYNMHNSKGIYEAKFEHTLGFYKMKSIKPYQIQKLYTNWLNGDSDNKPLKPRTIQNYHNLLNQILKSFVEWDELKSNPAEKVKLPQLDKPEKRIWTKEEVIKFLDAAENYQYYIAYYLAIFTGMRLGEVMGLEWKNIDFDQNTIYVKKQIGRGAKGKSVVKNYTKTNASRRSIYISEDVKDKLKAYKKKQDPKSAYVCTTTIGTTISESNIRRSMKSICKKANVPYISFHEQRHTHASLALQIGVEPKVIQERLGHSKLSTTMDTYTHTVPSLQKNFAEKYSDFF